MLVDGPQQFSTVGQEKQMKTAAHGSMTQLKGTRAALEDRVKKARGEKPLQTSKGGDGPEGAAGETGDVQKGARKQELSVKQEVLQGSRRLPPTAA